MLNSNSKASLWGCNLCYNRDRIDKPTKDADNSDTLKDMNKLLTTAEKQLLIGMGVIKSEVERVYYCNIAKAEIDSLSICPLGVIGNKETAKS